MTVKFPKQSELEEPLESFIITCIGAFRTLKNNGNFKRYEQCVIPFINNYKDMEYEDFKKECLTEIIRLTKKTIM